MKIIDRYVMLFSALLVLYAVIFRYGLSRGLENRHFIIVWVFAAAYGAVIFVTGWILGRAHSMGNFLFDLGLPFHAANYFAFGLVSECWFRLGYASHGESILVLHTTLLIWGVLLTIHAVVFLILRKKTIRGVSKSHIFQ